MRVLPDLWRYRGLLWDLITRDLRIRYRRAAVGVLWAVLQPLLMMLVLTFVFQFIFDKRLTDLGLTTDVPYPAFLLCGLVPWQFTATALIAAANALIAHQDLVKKVGFPREVVPMAAVGAAFVTFLAGLATLLAVVLYLGVVPGTAVAFLPLLVLLNVAMVAGLGLLLSCANVYYRDIAYMTEAALLFGFYATPIFYPIDFVARHYPQFVDLYMWNPMTGLVTAYRQALLGASTIDPRLLMPALVFTAAAALVGVVLFRRKAATIADLL